MLYCQNKQSQISFQAAYSKKQIKPQTTTLLQPNYFQQIQHKNYQQLSIPTPKQSPNQCSLRKSVERSRSPPSYHVLKKYKQKMVPQQSAVSCQNTQINKKINDLRQIPQIQAICQDVLSDRQNSDKKTTFSTDFLIKEKPLINNQQTLQNSSQNRLAKKNQQNSNVNNQKIKPTISQKNKNGKQMKKTCFGICDNGKQMKKSFNGIQNKQVALMKQDYSTQAHKHTLQSEDQNSSEDRSSQFDESSYYSKISTKSLNLQLQSNIKFQKNKLKLSAYLSKNTDLNETTLQKINKHLSVLKKIYLFLQQNNAYHQELEEWQQLHFLLLKKYYLQRIKIAQFFKKYPMKNPFKINGCQINTKQIIYFMKTQEGKKFLMDFELKNKKIKEQLNFYYGMFNKAKVGQQINLFDYDNFSKKIIQELWEQFILTQYNLDNQKEVRDQRLCSLLQIIFLISELNGQFLISFQSANQAIKEKDYLNYLSVAKTIYQTKLQYK